MGDVIFTGGSGRLGQEMKKIAPDFEYPNRKEFDVRSFEMMDRYIAKGKYRMIIHAAAINPLSLVDKDPDAALDTNISGSVRVARLCLKYGLRFVYLSTDYVFNGDKGLYEEDDPVLPADNYAWSKLGGACSAYLVPNHLIVRSSFGGLVFEYDKAFTDQWTSRDSVDVIAPRILRAAESDLVGVLHIGSGRRTVYEYARALSSSKNRSIGKISRLDTSVPIPRDTSLNTDKYKKLFPDG